MQTQQLSKQEEKKIKKPSRFDNVFFDAFYNVITYVPVAIISWIVSSLNLD